MFKRLALSWGASSVMLMSGLAGIAIGQATPAAAGNGCSNYASVQKDDFVTAASGYRLHGWLRHDYCDDVFAEQHRYWGGEDSRYCDGCGYHNLAYQYIQLRSWSYQNCDGVLWYNSTYVPPSPSAYDNLITPWTNDECYTPQADVHGTQKNGWSYSWYRNY